MQAAGRGVVAASARYAALRGALSLLGPLMWGALAADLALRAIGTDYARVVRAVFVLAQVGSGAAHFGVLGVTCRGRGLCLQGLGVMEVPCVQGWGCMQAGSYVNDVVRMRSNVGPAGCAGMGPCLACRTTSPRRVKVLEKVLAWCLWLVFQAGMCGTAVNHAIIGYSPRSTLFQGSDYAYKQQVWQRVRDSQMRSMLCCRNKTR